ncbi:hypothetical protein [Actinosynnema sp.]|uniref:hypothetical protein n=1 Tax=Actinosynnema sp. TaxID=1872144 RepID=UPI003F8491D5
MSRRLDASVLRTQLAGVVRAPLRPVLTGLPVLVAAFFACGAVLGQAVAERAVLDGLGGTPAGVERVRATPGVAEVQPRVSAGAVLAGAADRYLGLEADPGDGPLSLARVVEGRYPGAADEIAVNEVAAAGYGLKPGDRTTLVLPVGDGGQRAAEVLVTGSSPSGGGQAGDRVRAHRRHHLAGGPARRGRVVLAARRAPRGRGRSRCAHGGTRRRDGGRRRTGARPDRGRGAAGGGPRRDR